MSDEVIVYVSLLLSVLSGALLLLFPVISQPRNLKLLLSFSGAFLLSITFLHFIPEVYESERENIGLFILAGFLFQLFLEYFSEGIEHGHVHVHEHKHGAFPLVLMISLCIHAFIEGIPLEAQIGEHHNEIHGHSLLMGIVFHNIPVSIALMSMFLKSGISKSNAILYLSIFALMGPAGTFSGHLFGDHLNESIQGFFNIMLAIVIGMFMHISTTILFESSEGHKVNFYKLIAILTGTAVAMINF